MKKNNEKDARHIIIAVRHSAAIEGGNLKLAKEIAEQAEKEGIRISPPKIKE